jgi:hypothetical protein
MSDGRRCATLKPEITNEEDVKALHGNLA